MSRTTVKELREALEECDDNLPVFVFTLGHGPFECSFYHEKGDTWEGMDPEDEPGAPYFSIGPGDDVNDAKYSM